ncbi:hypothetical protein SAMN04489806_1066 [Paramicrobacterium humi]|uniref:Uncharacterized protein n=1 Tax=Paramicrobacterium humi TaxID=640635 RepID=A0A1H4KA06_9MICO|nr:hypothetical protein [Microbacterium humi]SEB54888.1 hypothetical protein SAMN04489806_1066 [Microbacterium humi]
MAKLLLASVLDELGSRNGDEWFCVRNQTRMHHVSSALLAGLAGLDPHSYLD